MIFDVLSNQRAAALPVPNKTLLFSQQTNAFFSTAMPLVKSGFRFPDIFISVSCTVYTSNGEPMDFENWDENDNEL